MCKFIIITFFFASVINSYCQATEDKFKPSHSLGLLIGHTLVGQGIDINGNKKWLSLPSWAIDYNYKFNPKWAIGLHNDIITENYKVENEFVSTSNVVIERSYPIASAAMIAFKPGKHFSYLVGAGGEFAKEANFKLIRCAVEYGYEIKKDWELNISVCNDLKIDAYNSWAISFGITKVL